MRVLRGAAWGAALTLCLVPASAAAPRLAEVGALTVSSKGGLGRVEVHGSIAAVNQRDEGVVALVDVGKPVRPRMLSRFDAAREGGDIATGGTPLDGDFAFSSDGSFLFYARQTTEFSEEGLHVLDVSDPAAPDEIFYQPQGGMLRVVYHDDGEREWLVTLDAIEGLVVSRFDRPTGVAVPVHVDALPALKVGGPGSAGLAVAGDRGRGRTRLYVATGRTGLEIFDFSNPALPRELGAWSEVGLADVEVVSRRGRHLVYAATEHWFDRNSEDLPPAVVVLDASDPAAIEHVGTISLNLPAAPHTRVQGIDIAGGVLYAAHSGEGLVAFDRRTGAVRARYTGRGDRNKQAGVPGAPHAIDVEVVRRLVFTTDAATGRLAILRR